MLFNLHRKLVPLDALKEKAKAYVESGLINEELAERVVRVIESERGTRRTSTTFSLVNTQKARLLPAL